MEHYKQLLQKNRHVNKCFLKNEEGSGIPLQWKTSHWWRIYKKETKINVITIEDSVLTNYRENFWKRNIIKSTGNYNELRRKTIRPSFVYDY